MFQWNVFYLFSSEEMVFTIFAVFRTDYMELTWHLYTCFFLFFKWCLVFDLSIKVSSKCFSISVIEATSEHFMCQPHRCLSVYFHFSLSCFVFNLSSLLLTLVLPFLTFSRFLLLSHSFLYLFINFLSSFSLWICDLYLYHSVSHSTLSQSYRFFSIDYLLSF